MSALWTTPENDTEPLTPAETRAADRLIAGAWHQREEPPTPADFLRAAEWLRWFAVVLLWLLAVVVVGGALWVGVVR